MIYVAQPRHYTNMRITPDLEGGGEDEYDKFGDFLVEVKAVMTMRWKMREVSFTLLDSYDWLKDSSLVVVKVKDLTKLAGFKKSGKRPHPQPMLDKECVQPSCSRLLLVRMKNDHINSDS